MEINNKYLYARRITRKERKPPMKYVSAVIVPCVTLMLVSACKFDDIIDDGYDPCSVQSCEDSSIEETSIEQSEEESDIEVITTNYGNTTLEVLQQIVDSSYEPIGNYLGPVRSFANMRILLTESSLYTMVHMESGIQIGMPFIPEDNMYFRDSECTGDAAMLHWYGNVGETKVYSKNGRYYQTVSTIEYSASNPFRARSKITFDAGICEETETEIQTRAVNLGEVNEPMDLEERAPLSIYIE